MKPQILPPRSVKDQGLSKGYHRENSSTEVSTHGMLSVKPSKMKPPALRTPRITPEPEHPGKQVGNRQGTNFSWHCILVS